MSQIRRWRTPPASLKYEKTPGMSRMRMRATRWMIRPLHVWATTANAAIATESAKPEMDETVEWRLASLVENGTPTRKGAVEKKPESRMAKP